MSQSLFTTTGAFAGVKTAPMKLNMAKQTTQMRTTPMMRASVNPNVYSVKTAQKSIVTSSAAPRSGVNMTMSASGPAASNFGSVQLNKFSSAAVPNANNYNFGGEINMNADTSNWGKMQSQQTGFNTGEYAQNMNDMVN